MSNSASSKAGSATRSTELQATQKIRVDFLGANPDIVEGISQLDYAIAQNQRLRVQQTRLPVQSPWPTFQPRLGHDPHLEYVHHQQIVEGVPAPQIGGPGI